MAAVLIYRTVLLTISVNELKGRLIRIVQV